MAATGSGTLVAAMRRPGWCSRVRTCSIGSTANIVVAFPNGERFAARLVERDRAQRSGGAGDSSAEVEPLT